MTLAGAQVRLGTRGEVVSGDAATDQSIRFVLGVQRGSVPLSRDLGLDWFEILDRPVGDAAPLVIRQATEALRRWLPSVVVVSIVPVIEGEAIRVRVTWQPDRGEPRDVEVSSS